MPTLRDLINQMKELEEALPEILKEASVIMAHDAKALAERIIKDKGFGAVYSSNKVPSWFLVGKELNVAGLNYIYDAYDDDEGVNWSGLRDAQGLQTKHVDLAYTTRMWKGMRPDEVKEENGRYFCLMGHNDNEGRKKMNWNFERYGDFIGKALKGQEEVLEEVATENILLLLEKYL